MSLEKADFDKSEQNEVGFRGFIENLPVMFYAAEPDPPYAPIYVSPAFAQLGYPLEKWTKIKDFWTRVLHPEDRDWVLKKTGEARRDGTGIDYEYRITAQNGTVHWVHDRGSLTRDARGNLVCWQGIILDVTERRQAEESLRESAARLHSIFENANDLIYVHDLKGNFLSVNKATERIFGYTFDEALGMNMRQVLAPEYLEISRRNLAEKLAHNAEQTVYEVECITKSGGRVKIEINSSPIYKDGKVIAVQGIARDITEQKRAEKALKDSELRYRQLGEGIMHQVWTAKPDGQLDYINRRALDYVGRANIRKSGGNWQYFVHPEDLAECDRLWKHSLATGEDYITQYRLRRHDGEYCWFQGRGAAGRDADGKIISWFGTNSDIENQKKIEERIHHIAEHDVLTNLPNRAKFMHHLERAVIRTEYNPSFRFAVLFLDLDRFKIINDSLGHGTGDKLLVALSERIADCLRPNDVVARLGGDEFTVLLRGIDKPSTAARVAERILKKLSAPFQLDAYEVFTSASIGIIVSDDVKRQPDDFLRDADAAMYRAKAAGKARYEIFDREMHIQNMNLLQLENDLRWAVERQEFRAFYQPIVALETGEIIEFEALLRWQHPQRGLIAPNDFIGIAEETGLIVPIGRWILEEACRQTTVWQARFSKHEHLSVSVNLSAKQLLHPNMLAEVNNVLEITAFDSRRLKLEVTESMVMENGEKSLSVINSFRALGVAVSTDDFGTGYSSLSYLHQFPFDRLKIDRSFVGKMEKDSKSEAIVRTILMLAQNLEIETVAEGVENAEQLKQLRQLGCRFGQGYFFSKPVDANSAEEMLKNGLTIRALPKNIFDYRELDEKKIFKLENVQ